MNSNEKIDYLFKILLRFDHYINVANTKALGLATVLVTLYIALISFFGTSVLSNIKVLNEMSFAYCISFSVLVFISFSAFFSFNSALKVIFPDLRNIKNIETYKSNIFFGDISSRELKDFKNEISNLSYDIYIDDLENQVYTLSCIVKDKFKNMNKAMENLLYYFIPLCVVFIIQYVIFVRG